TSRIRTGHVIAAFLTERNLARPLVDAVPELGKIPGERLLNELTVVTAGSIEDEQDTGPLSSGNGAGAAASSAAGPGAAGGPTKTPNLDQFTINLTERARKGELDPVIGRDFEIRQVIDILTRRRQNNPILTGEAGVGKTAVVEGFALRVINKDVPPS